MRDGRRFSARMHQPARRRRRGPRRNHCSYPGCSWCPAPLGWKCRPPLRRSGRACWLDRPHRLARPCGTLSPASWDAAGTFVSPAPAPTPGVLPKPGSDPDPGAGVPPAPIIPRVAGRLPVTAERGARPDSGTRPVSGPATPSAEATGATALCITPPVIALPAVTPPPVPARATPDRPPPAAAKPAASKAVFAVHDAHGRMGTLVWDTDAGFVAPGVTASRHHEHRA